MIMYGKYNSDTLMTLIDTVHQMQNVTMWKEKIFVSEMNDWLKHRLEDVHSEFDYSMDTAIVSNNCQRKVCENV